MAIDASSPSETTRNCAQSRSQPTSAMNPARAERPFDYLRFPIGK